MTNISKINALVALFGLTAAVTPATADTAPEACPALAWVTVEGEAVQLPADVAGNVVKLQSYGSRYARAVALIVAENARPEWTFGAACPTDGVDVVAAD